MFSGYILRNRTNLQFTWVLFLRLVVEYDSFEGTQRVDAD